MVMEVSVLGIIWNMDIRENSFTERVVKHWDRLPWVLEESPAPEMFKRGVDVTLGDTV